MRSNVIVVANLMLGKTHLPEGKFRTYRYTNLVRGAALNQLDRLLKARRFSRR